MTRELLLAGLLQMKNLKLREDPGLKFPSKLLLFAIIIVATMY